MRRPATQAALRLREMIGETEEIAGARTVARDRPICPSCDEPGKLLSIGSGRWGDCDDCGIRWFLDTKGPVGSPEFAARITNCPSCGKAARWLNVGSSHWGACRDCEVRWPIGVNLTASWRDETEQEWEHNGKLLAEYTDAD